MRVTRRTQFAPASVLPGVTDRIELLPPTRSASSSEGRLQLVFSLFALMFCYSTVSAFAQDALHGADSTSKPEVKNSLDGGTNYAYGFASTRRGTSAFTFGPSDELFVDVDNIGQQITTYLATHPKIDDKTLFVVWGGAKDLLNATSSDDVIDSGIDQAVNIQRYGDSGNPRSSRRVSRFAPADDLNASQDSFSTTYRRILQ